MASINKAILIGNLGADPEVRTTQSGTQVANFNIATTDQWTDQSGQRQERTEWHRVVAWGRLGEICAQYLRKGKQVYIEGRIQTRKWEDKNGQTRYTTEIVAQTMQMLGRAGDGGHAVPEDGAPAEEPAGQAVAARAGAAGAVGGFDQTDDDLPF